MCIRDRCEHLAEVEEEFGKTLVNYHKFVAQIYDYCSKEFESFYAHAEFKDLLMNKMQDIENTNVWKKYSTAKADKFVGVNGEKIPFPVVHLSSEEAKKIGLLKRKPKEENEKQMD